MKNVFKKFFPFGVYASPPDTSGEHQISARMAFRMLVRHHLNFVLASQNRVVEGEEMGMYIGRRMRPCSQRFESGGAQEVKEWAAPMVERVKNSPALICYEVGDEREIGELWDTVGGMGVLNQLDPSHPSLLCFHKVASLRRYDPYVAVNVSDIYPVSAGLDTTATYLYDYCREIARETDNKRHWMILQSFGAAPWRRKWRWYVPTVEQLRLQVYSALAGGAMVAGFTVTGAIDRNIDLLVNFIVTKYHLVQISLSKILNISSHLTILLTYPRSSLKRKLKL